MGARSALAQLARHGKILNHVQRVARDGDSVYRTPQCLCLICSSESPQSRRCLAARLSLRIISTNSEPFNLPRLTSPSFKTNPASIETTYIDEATGEEKKRLINRQRWKGWAPIAISYSEPTPQEGPANAQAEVKSVNQVLLSRVTQVSSSISTRLSPTLLVIRITSDLDTDGSV